MTEKTYETYVLESGETKRDIDIVYNPIFRDIKNAFAIMFASEDMKGSDFKRLSDMQYYQGGYPNPDTLPKEHSLAIQVANLMRLEGSLEKHNFSKFLNDLGVTCGYVKGIDTLYATSDDDEKKLKKAWEGAGIDEPLPDDRIVALGLLLARAQNLQKEICEVTDTVRVDAANEVEAKYQITKPNFMKAVGLAAISLKRGAGVMAEKIDDLDDSIENLQAAIAPLAKR